MTIEQVSERCNLSVSAISKALNNYPDISSKTREYVQSVAREMGYRPNPLSRAFKSKRAYNVGVLFWRGGDSALVYSSFAATMSNFRRQMARHGYDVTILHHDANDQSASFLSHCLQRNVDGMCVLCADFASPQMRELIGSGLPMVTVDHPCEGRPCVGPDHQEDARKLTRYAGWMGHERIAFVHGEDSPVTALRLNGYRAALQEMGLEARPDYLQQGGYHDPGRTGRVTALLMGLKEPPTCILMPDDCAALGGLEALRGLGLRVPQDVSIAGCDGIKLMQMMRPQLTTIEQDVVRIGVEAAEQLINQIERRGEPLGPVIVESKLIAGETIGRIP